MNKFKTKIGKRVRQGVIGSLLLASGSSICFAGVTCSPQGAWSPLPLMTIDMNTLPGAVPPGTTLGSGNSVFLWRCTFSGSESDRTIWFYNTTAASIKNYLLSSGIRLYQESYGNEVEVTASTTPPLKVGSWNTGTSNLALWHTFTLKKGDGELKAFDTGEFIIGYHRDAFGNRIGENYTIRIIGKLVNYCPTPIVTMSDKEVNFNELTPEQFSNGKTVKENFDITLTPISTCDAALEVSVAFQSNSGVVSSKYLMFDNGLQAVITDRELGQEVTFDQYYKKGTISQQSPGTYQYSVELSNKDNQPIKQGAFSNTVNILFSY